MTETLKTASEIVRVLVVDDSAYLRKVISEMLGRSPRIQVVGTARDGLDALEKVAQLQPDVVTLDLTMDGLDGVGFLKAQMPLRPLPVVVCSIASQDGKQAVAAMEAGAVEFIRKPTALYNESVYQIGDDLVEKVLTAASIPSGRLPVGSWAVTGELVTDGNTPAPVTALPLFPARPNHIPKFDALVIGVSTGGPQALRKLLPLLPADFPAAIAIVLHMPVGYTGPLAEKLDELSGLEVLEARSGLPMQPGRAILGQSGFQFHLRRLSGSSDDELEPQVIAYLDHTPRDTAHTPAVDVLFKDAADIYHKRLLALVLTGMGDDGRQGSAWVKAQGGLVFTEAEETCVVYGMPRSVVEAGLSDQSVPLHQVVDVLMESLW